MFSVIPEMHKYSRVIILGEKMSPTKNEIGNPSDDGVTSLTNWAEVKAKEVDVERQEQLKEKGITPFLKLPEGTSVVKFMNEVPVERNTGFGKKYDFHVEYNGTMYTWSISPRSPLFRQILANLKHGVYTMSIVRAGTDKNTKYSIISSTPANK